MQLSHTMITLFMSLREHLLQKSLLVLLLYLYRNESHYNNLRILYSLNINWTDI